MPQQMVREMPCKLTLYGKRNTVLTELLGQEYDSWPRQGGRVKHDKLASTIL